MHRTMLLCLLVISLLFSQATFAYAIDNLSNTDGNSVTNEEENTSDNDKESYITLDTIGTDFVKFTVDAEVPYIRVSYGDKTEVHELEKAALSAQSIEQQNRTTSVVPSLYEPKQILLSNLCPGKSYSISICGFYKDIDTDTGIDEEIVVFEETLDVTTKCDTVTIVKRRSMPGGISFVLNDTQRNETYRIMYKEYRADPSTYESVILTPHDNVISLTGLKYCQSYNYIVQAIAEDGTLSNQSFHGTLQTMAPPKPGTGALKHISTSTDKFIFEFTPSNDPDTDYSLICYEKVGSGPDSYFTKLGTTSLSNKKHTFAKTGLHQGVTYGFVLRAERHFLKGDGTKASLVSTTDKYVFKTSGNLDSAIPRSVDVDKINLSSVEFNTFGITTSRYVKTPAKFRVIYSLHKNFKSNKTIIVSPSSLTTFKIKHLKPGRKYYYKIDSYYNLGGKKVYSRKSLGGVFTTPSKSLYKTNVTQILLKGMRNNKANKYHNVHVDLFYGVFTKRDNIFLQYWKAEAVYQQYFQRFKSFSVYGVGNTYTGILFKSARSAAASIKKGKRVDAKINKIVRKAKRYKSRRAQIKYVDKAICKICSYDTTTRRPNTGNPYGALVEGKATCLGYSEAFFVCMTRLNIPVDYVINKNCKHIWCKVKVGKKWYHVDTCWNDIGNRSCRKYFMLSEKQMRKYPHHHK